METKKAVSEFVRLRGCNTAYSGKTRTMHIKGAEAKRVKREAEDQFPNTPFTFSAE